MHACNCSCRLFFVVVRFASVVCSSICFFPDRNTKWWREIRRVLRLFLDNLTRQAIHLYSCLSLWPPGSSLVHIFSYAYAILELCSCHVSYPLVTWKQTILPPLPAYYPLLDVCCLASRSACLSFVVISIWYRDMLGGWYMTHLWIMLVKLIMIIVVTKTKVGIIT